MRAFILTNLFLENKGYINLEVKLISQRFPFLPKLSSKSISSLISSWSWVPHGLIWISVSHLCRMFWLHLLLVFKLNVETTQLYVRSVYYYRLSTNIKVIKGKELKQNYAIFEFCKRTMLWRGMIKNPKTTSSGSEIHVLRLILKPNKPILSTCPN